MTEKKIFLIGIGGIGMSALAIIMKKRGYNVIGSDRSYSKTIENLEKLGIKVFIGHDEKNIDETIDEVIYTNAISDDNPEFLKAKSLNIPIKERALKLQELAQNKFSIGISGTHGKTTTTSLISKVFLNAGFDPSLAVGGYLDEINGSGYDGKGKYFIYEACEAYESFLRLKPNIAVLTNIDDDHLDYYKTFDNIKNSFLKYITNNVPPYGFIIYNKDDITLREVVKKSKLKNIISTGIRCKADWNAVDIELNDFYSSFTVLYKNQFVGRYTLNIPGIHNVSNSLLCIAASIINGVPDNVIKDTLLNFKNAERRFQLKYNNDKLIIIDDYAHHPSEIVATLKMAKKLSSHKKAKLIAVFQPHLYSRTEHLYKDFAKSLSIADKVILTDIYAAREKNTNKITSKIIYDEIVKIKGKNKVTLTENLNNIPEKIKEEYNEKKVIITLGAGDVWKVSDILARIS